MGRVALSGRWARDHDRGMATIVGRSQSRAAAELGAGAAMGIATAGSLALGLATTAVMPRGPITSVGALAVMASTLAIGVLVGSIVRSRWTMLVVTLAYAVGVEAGRIGAQGASLEMVRLDTVFGVLAFIVGRGLHLLLAVLPMVVGIGLGRASAEARRPRVPTFLGAVAVIGLAALVAWPASTPPIVDASGQPIPGSVAEVVGVPINGTDQTISIRAADPDAPVILYLSGGPGQSDLGYGRVLLEPLTHDFVVAIWDQRGNGRSYPAIEPTDEMTLEQAVADTVAVVEYLRERFDEEGVYLLGESWGSTLGVLAAKERPDLFHAYLGSGQMVSQRQTDRQIWRDLLAHASAIGDGDLFDEVLTLGEPPYDDMPWSNARVLGWYGLIQPPYAPPQAYVERATATNLGPFGILASEYSFIDKANALRGLVDTFDLLYPQLQDIDLRTDVPSLDVPVYVFDGANELTARRRFALEWFAGLDAPVKRLITYADAGHASAFEHADDVRDLLVTEIVRATYGR